MKMSTEDAALIAESRHIGTVLPAVAAQAARQETAVKNRIFLAITRGDLTPDAAFSAWHEIHAIHKMLVGLQGKLRLGEAVAEEHSAEMQIGDK